MRSRGGELEPFLLLSNVPGWLDTGVVIAATRCGAVGLLNFQGVADLAQANKALAQIQRFAKSEFGVKLDAESALSWEILQKLPAGARFVVLAATNSPRQKELAAAVRKQNRRLLVEVTSVEQAAAASEYSPEALIAKGHESGGSVGEETCFVLLQHLLAQFSIPVWAYGGIGLHSAAACYAAGAAGVVLDNQLLLTPESTLPVGTRAALERMSGDETVCLGSEFGAQYRFYKRAGTKAVTELQELERELVRERPADACARWIDALNRRIGWGNLEAEAWPVGQDGVLAAPLAKRFYNVAGIVGGIRESVRQHVIAVKQSLPLNPGSSLAQSHGTAYPILQGPMTRVSDTAAFAAAVAENGALPFLALALLRAAQVRSLLEETARLVPVRPWGVGILGFVPEELRKEQLAVVQEVKPAFCIIAGGRPDQAKHLEESGITTYLHVPAPQLLRIFVEDGARRFIFEGRECGGHVGPRTSFVLWEEMIAVLLEAIEKGTPAGELHVVFAGGIHDARSAAMVAAMAAPLAERGVRLGVLMGTAYLFTEEAIAGGAILPGFQQEALTCQSTVLLESGTGHVTRCVPTAFVDTFHRTRRELERAGKSAHEVRDALEDLNVGRLRIASKGITHGEGAASKYVEVSEEQQRSEGMYMIGQVAALRGATCTMRALHEEVTSGSGALLNELKVPFESSPEASGWASQPCDVAIVGLGCLLPQARDVDSFWSNILNKVDAITEIPKERFDASLYYDSEKKSRDKVYSKWGGFLGDIPFDPIRYGIPPNALPSIDPMQLLTLLVVDQALQDAGYDKRDFPRERTSVILGLSGGLGDLGIKYAVRASLPMYLEDTPPELLERLPEWTEDSFPGILLNVVAGRVANRFNFGGVNFTIDAACASSLAAVYVAARELATGSSDMVVVGGVDTVQSPFGFLCFAKSQALSPNGRCSTFDESADGIAISEGLSVLVLKRLADAERDGDKIYAVIKGIAGSGDGRGRSMTAPRLEGQVLAMKRAYQQAGISPATVSLIEAHGTGTVAGDSTETASLTELFLADGAQPQSCAIGSVKSMVGHTKSAAGTTGLLKTALALYHKVLPPTINVERPNAALRDPRSPFFPNIDAQRWLAASPETPRRAGVSSFGFGGTNFHAVLEEYTGEYRDPLEIPGAEDWPAELFLWKAASREALRSSIETAESLLPAATARPFREFASYISRKAGRGEWSLGIVARSTDELRQKLAAAKNSLETGSAPQSNTGVFIGQAATPPKVAFLFSGQGSQFPGMLRDLSVYFPEFPGVLDDADRALAGCFPRKLSSYIYPAPAFSDEDKRLQMEALTDTVVAQPALGAVEIALYQLLGRFGILPDMVAGHSYGEYVALCAAGVISPEDLFRISEARGRAIKQSAGKNAGTMAAVAGGGREVADAIAGIPGVLVANFNSPRQTIIAGEVEAVKQASDVLAAAKFAVRPIPVACAFHSHLMEPASERLAASLSNLGFSAPAIPVYSNTVATRYPAHPEAIAKLLVTHLTQPVRFHEEIESLYNDGARVFIEVGPKGVLSGLARQILEGLDTTVIQTDVTDRNGVVQLLHTLGQLAVLGVPVDTAKLFLGRVREQFDFSREAAPAESAWLVNGAGAFPRNNPPRALPPVTVTKTVAVPQPTAVAPGVPMSGNAAGWKPAPPMSGNADAVMLQFQQLMSQFLQTQSSIMTAFLQGGMAQPAPALSIPVPQPIVAPPAPVPPAPIAAAPKPQQRDIPAELLAIVAEKTGYPQEMLSLDANMEADLGIDSIKRVEILSAFQRSCSSAEQTVIQGVMEKLTRGRTLGEIAALLSGAIGSKPESAPALAVAPAQRDIPAELLKIVSDKTGYPTEMLSLDAGMEADLGIDSIKRVEILSAFQRSCSATEQTAIQAVMEKLTRARTLGEIAAQISTVLGTQPASGSAPVAPPQRDIPAELLHIVGDKTGYPIEMLGLDAAIEADLGIDSIKRVEILSAFQRACSPVEQSAIQGVMEKLTRARTLNEMAGLLSTAIVPEPPKAAAKADEIRAVPRFTLVAVEKPRAHAKPITHPGRVCLITDDETGLAAHIAQEWNRSGEKALLLRHSTDALVEAEGVWHLDLTNPEAVQSTVEKIRAQHGSIGAVVHVLPLRTNGTSSAFPEWREHLRVDVRSLYLLARATESDLAKTGRKNGALFAAVTGRGGAFGVEPSASLSPHYFAVADFVKTAAIEFTEVSCKVVDLDPTDPLPILKRKLQEELESADETVQVGLPGDRRLTVLPRLSAITVAPTIKIQREWVCLLTGGARGITAQIAKKLASTAKPTLVLAGTAALRDEPEPPEIRGITEAAKLKAALAAQLRAVHGSVKPADVEAAYQQVLRNREIRGTIEALRAAGSRVEYHSIDVRQEAEVKALIEGIYGQYGRLDLVIHGAGIIEDKLIRDKTPESFDRVLHTKADSSYFLTQYLRHDSLKCLIFMSSITAAFGNRGQADYAAANGVMNGFASMLAAQWPCRVTAMNWGPWDQGGMVSEEVRKQFLSLGVQLIAPAAGADAVLREIESGDRADAVAAFGDGPWGKFAVTPAALHQGASA